MRRYRFGFVVLALAAAPAIAEQASGPVDPGRRVDELIDTSRQAFGEAEPQRQSCAQADPNEIVVCVDRGRDQRVASTAQTDPNSLAARRALDGNIPSAPFVGSIRCRKGADGVCRGNMGSAPVPAYFVDVTALPQAPEGSDADRIAKGEIAAP
ncbi:MAG: hypothetical protein ABL914_08255 [Novosphingobium sp.]|uniref:hypothetical protein n=1 Tax=Novosphingobium sp. TaxID=1874826 RepID=UPI0032BE3A72